MFYKLNENLCLRGWDKLPYAIRDMRDGQTQFIDEYTFQALSFCDGMIDCDSVLLLPRHKEIIAKLKENKIVKPCEQHDALLTKQKYKCAPCRYIKQAHWSITGKCNMRCRHCYMSAPQAKYGELPHETCMDIIRQLAEANISEINLTGGEPLVRNDFLEIVDALIAENIFIRQIYTNGMLVNQKLLDELKNRGTKPQFSISFDGVGWHDWLRGIDGAEKMTVDAIKLLRKNNFDVGVESAFHGKSLHTLPATMELLAELGVSSWKTNPASNSGNWAIETDKVDIPVEELYNAYLQLIPEYLKAGSPLNIMLGGFFYCKKGTDKYTIPCKKFNGTEKMLRIPLCGCARNMMYIAADGKILPCMPLAGLPIQEEMPNITKVPLTAALSDSQYLKRIDTRLEELLQENNKCGACEHKLYCGGGCRAGALITTGEYLGYDGYTCFFFKNGYENRIKAIINSF